MTEDKIGGETWPGAEMTLLNGTDEGGYDRTKDGAVEKSSKVRLGRVGADGTGRGSWRLRRSAGGDGCRCWFRRKRYVPKSIRGTFAFDDCVGILNDVYMVPLK